MDKQDFLLLLKEIHTPDHLRGKPFEQYSEIIETFGRENFYPVDFSEAINLMERFIISFPEEETSSFSKLTPQDSITSDFLVDKIDPWVKQIRKDLFGSSKQPFDWDQAIKWIENQEKRSRGPKKDPEIISNLIRQAKSEKKKKRLYKPKALEELRKKLDRPLSLSLSRPSLPYIKKNKDPLHWIPADGSKLTALAYETEKIERATGFNQASLVMYVLSGIKPLLPRYRISIKTHAYTMPNKEQLTSREVELVFRCRDLKFGDLLRIHKEIKKSLSLKREIPLKEKSERVYKLIKELGPPPHGIRGKRNKQYWEKAKGSWNNRYPDEQYKDWRAVVQQYDRITEFLERIQKCPKT